MKTYITLEDENGILRPKALLESDDEYGIEVAKDFLVARQGGTIVRIEIKKIETII